MVGSESQDEQGLRKAVRNERSVHPRGDDTSDGEALSSCLGFIKQFQKGYSRKPVFIHPYTLRYLGVGKRACSPGFLEEFFSETGLPVYIFATLPGK